MNFKPILIIATCFIAIIATGQNTIRGTVNDSANGQTIPGVVIFLPELKLQTTSDVNGNYKISQVPSGSWQIEAELEGYKIINRKIAVNADVTLNFVMAVSASTEKEVIITALGNATTALRAPVPVTLVPHETFLQESATNAVDAIATQPGVTAITTGPGVSKPEIRGLGFNRVLTLFDGVRQQDFQWGDEHGIQIDPYAIYDAEIIRGAASLQYGSDAVGGVVSFKPVPLPEAGSLSGSILTEYQTNNGLIGTSEQIMGNIDGLILDERASFQDAHCFWNPKDGYVWSTAFRDYDGRITIGIAKKWGYSKLTFSALHRTIEIPDGNRDSATGKFKFDFPINGRVLPGSSNFLSYNPTYVGYQEIEHDVVVWQNSINVGKGRVLADVGYTKDHREEIDTGTVPLLNMSMYDIPYSIRYQVEGENSGLKLTTGVNGMYEAMQNAPEAAKPYISVFLVPDYKLFDIGGFGILEKDINNLTISGGLRYDTRIETASSLYLLNAGTSSQSEVPENTPGAYTNFQGFNTNYNGFSGCLGASYQLPVNWYIKANISRSYRAPAITEIGENGIHPGTFNFEIGDPNLKPEAGNEADFAVGNNNKDLSFEADGFYNSIDNFIFASKIASKSGGDSITQGFPTFKFQTRNALLMGVDAYLKIHPQAFKWLEIDNGFTYIYSFFPHQTDSTEHVPYTPAPRLTSEAQFKIENADRGLIRNTYFKFGLAQYWAQNNIYSAYGTELPSVEYTLFNAGAGTDIVNRKTGMTICSLYINCSNLMNTGYADHTSRTQYFLAYNGVTPVPVTSPAQGIYNMGRNIGFKLIFPIGGKKTYNGESPAEG